MRGLEEHGTKFILNAFQCNVCAVRRLRLEASRLHFGASSDPWVRNIWMLDLAMLNKWRILSRLSRGRSMQLSVDLPSAVSRSPGFVLRHKQITFFLWNPHSAKCNDVQSVPWDELRLRMPEVATVLRLRLGMQIGCRIS